jgi:sortase A
VPPGGAIDHMVIPAIHVDKYVVEGTNEEDLRKGPGHYPGTPYPGQPGNVAIAGHRTTYGAPFFELNALKTGDLIRLTDLNDRTWDYIVSAPPVVVSPNDVSVLNPTPFPQLTLTTCNPRFSASTRMVVFARLKGQAGAVQAPPVAVISKPSVLPGDGPSTGAATPAKAASTNLGRGRSAAEVPSALYGLLVVALWVLVRLAINRTRRWYRLGAYVVGIGVCLIPLWFCFENVILLLPQSI